MAYINKLENVQSKGIYICKLKFGVVEPEIILLNSRFAFLKTRYFFKEIFIK